MFGIGERVIFRRNDGVKERGKITRILPRSRKVVTASGIGSDLCNDWESQENCPKRAGLFALNPLF